MISSNFPPGSIEFAREVIEAVNVWLKDNPVIETEESARSGKLMLDRAKNALIDIEQERETKVAPLNLQIANINGEYKAVHNTDKKKPGIFDKVVNELRSRIAVYIAAEERKRIKAAAEAAELAAELERQAREAEAKEKESLAEAAMGVIDVDVEKAIQQADEAFSAYEAAERAAALAERESRVKVGGGFARATSLRTREVLVVTDAQAALQGLGLTDKIREAILSSAREFRKVMGELPSGIEATFERVL